MGSARLLFIAVLLLDLVSGSAAAQDDGKIKDAAKIVREHVEKVIKQEYPAFEQSYGKQVAQRVAQDSKAKQYQCPGGNCQGALEHPWKQNGNPLGGVNYVIDSSVIKQFSVINFPNWTKLHGCFEFGLLAHSYTSDGTTTNSDDGTPLITNGDPEGFECQAYCLVSSMFLCPMHAPRWWFLLGDNKNGAETAMYWFPEYQVATNNYGINRVNPAELGQPLFTRQALVGAKSGNDQQKAQEAGQTYPFKPDKLPQQFQQDPLQGNGWAGFYFPDFQEKRYAHVYRTEFSVGKSDLKIQTKQGWKENPEKALLDSFPKKSSEHAKANVWTEYGMFDIVTGIPQLSYKIYGSVGGKIMNALFGAQRPIMQAAKETPPFWQSQGAMAYRVATWPQDFGNLKDQLQIKPSANAALREAVYKGGYELYPLVSNLSGFGTPTLSAAAIVARRGLYIAGENMMMMPHYPKNVPSPRILQYTIDSGDKAREIDKMQRIRPFKNLLSVSECFRSQNIANMTTSDKGLESWTEQNMPRTLLRYTMDPELLGIQGNDPTFVYWNRRMSCHCRHCGIMTGSITFPGWEGDDLYARRRRALCTYRLGETFSAWKGEDTWPMCKLPPEQFQIFRGLNDQV